jgi:hypothetical protein
LDLNKDNTTVTALKKLNVSHYKTKIFKWRNHMEKLKSLIFIFIFIFIFHSTSSINAKEKIYASLTTTSYRISSLEPTIDSILKQTLTPQKIYICLGEDPFLQDTGFSDRSQIPKNILDLEASGLIEFIFCKNLGPHKKLLPILKKHKNDHCVIITFDDDAIYSRRCCISRIENSL